MTDGGVLYTVFYIMSCFVENTHRVHYGPCKSRTSPSFTGEGSKTVSARDEKEEQDREEEELNKQREGERNRQH